MKKTFQIIRGLSLLHKDASTPWGSVAPVQNGEGNQAVNVVSVNERLKDGYSKCTGVFVVPEKIGEKLSNVTITLKIAQQEVLPVGFALSLITYDGNSSLADTTYDFRQENIPARSSEAEITIECLTSLCGTQTERKNAQLFDLYLVLENE